MATLDVFVGPRPRGRLATAGFLAALAGLAVLAYWRTLGLPFIADDYVQIWLARAFGPVTGWKDLAADALYRCRSTSLVLTYWTERAFGLNPLAYTLTGTTLHIVNTWLVFALGVWRPIGWRLSAAAAVFFAVYEGHQEAVIWYAALPELLIFLFCMAAFIEWVRFIQSGRKRHAAASLLLFVLALLSKESAVVLVPLMLLPVWSERPAASRWLPAWGAAGLLAMVYTGLVFLGKTNHLHFHDGTFSVHAPFWMTIPRSMFRLAWVWGFLALLALAATRAWRAYAPVLRLAAVWAAVAFLPYAFLTYMPFVPSRHTYLASAGLAVIAGAAALALLDRMPRRPWAILALAVLVALPNCAYIWTRKHRQFAERAAPTERLVEFARNAGDPVYVHCFPYGFDAADWAVQLRVRKRAVKLDGPLPRDGRKIFCFPPHRSHTETGQAAALQSGRPEPSP